MDSPVAKAGSEVSRSLGTFRDWRRDPARPPEVNCYASRVVDSGVESATRTWRLLDGAEARGFVCLCSSFVIERPP